MVYALIILLFPFSRIFHLPLWLSDPFEPRWKIVPEGSNMDQISFLQEKGPPFIFPPKHTEALHLSLVPPPSWILLYVNSMYLRCLEGSTASAGDSEKLHFSPLTKGKRPRLAPRVLDQQNRCFWSTEGSLFQPLNTTTPPLYLSLTFHKCIMGRKQQPSVKNLPSVVQQRHCSDQESA